MISSWFILEKPNKLNLGQYENYAMRRDMKKDLFKIRVAIPSDVPVILQGIKELEDFEKFEVIATKKNCMKCFFMILKAQKH